MPVAPLVCEPFRSSVVLCVQAHQTVQQIAQRPTQVFQIPLCFVGGHPDIVLLQPACVHALLQGQQINQGQPANTDRPARRPGVLEPLQLSRINPPQDRPQFITVISFVKSIATLPLLPP